MSLLSVHAWSLVSTVESVVIATIVVVVVLLLPLRPLFLWSLEPQQPVRCLLTKIAIFRLIWGES